MRVLQKSGAVWVGAAWDSLRDHTQAQQELVVWLIVGELRSLSAGLSQHFLACLPPKPVFGEFHRFVVAKPAVHKMNSRLSVGGYGKPRKPA